MNPLVIPGIATGIGTLGALWRAGQQPSPEEMLRRILSMWSSGRISSETQAYYKRILNSPAFRQVLSDIGRAGAGMEAGLAKSLGRTGLATSGVGAASRGLARSATAFQGQAARAGAWSSAQDAILQLMRSQLGAAGFIAPSAIRQYGNDPYMSMFANMMGAGGYGLMNQSPGQQYYLPGTFIGRQM